MKKNVFYTHRLCITLLKEPTLKITQNEYLSMDLYCIHKIYVECIFIFLDVSTYKDQRKCNSIFFYLNPLCMILDVHKPGKFDKSLIKNKNNQCLWIINYVR